MMSDELSPTPTRRSIPPVAPEIAALTGQLQALQWACEEVAAGLPVGRVPRDLLAELADMLEAVTPAARSLVGRMVIEGGHVEEGDDPVEGICSICGRRWSQCKCQM